jgi:NADH dehydrogenase
MTDTPRVVIVGAGFGGLAVARGLAGAAVEVTLVDRHNFHTFLPLLYQVATAGLNAADIAHAVRGIVRGLDNVAFRQATVTAVDWDEHVVRLEEAERLPFDLLVVAPGATAEHFGVPGAAEHGLPLYTLADAAALRNHILERFEAADADPALVDDGVLTFAVVGGGATGVEVAGALAELFGVVLRRDFPRLDTGRARIVLLEMGDDLLPAFGPSGRADARATLEDRGVEVRTGAAVAEVTPTRVHLSSGEQLAAHTLIWAAGVKASPLAAALGVEVGRGGRIVVGPGLRIPGRPEAFAIGDVAAIGDGHGGVLPGVAQVAIQSGRHVAAEIRRQISGQAPQPFRYVDKGTMATIGRRAAVAEIPVPGGGTAHLRGTPGWLAWLGLHLVYLVGFRNRASVLLNWAWNYLTWDRGPRLIFGGSTRRDGTGGTGGPPAGPDVVP